MANRTNLSDPSTGSGVFVGDLKYGRCHGNEKVKHKDFPLIDEETGEVNLPAVPLVLVPRRDPSLWTKDRTKKIPKVKFNSPELENKLLAALVTQTGGLLHNVRIKVGRRSLI
jgi:hypothetical protein